MGITGLYYYIFRNNFKNDVFMFYLYLILYFSDDGEREDSDNDVRSSPRRSGKEYRDTMDSIERIGKIPSSLPSSNASPAKGPRPLKKVDLGAAANYGKDQSNVLALFIFLIFYISSLIFQNFLLSLKQRNK